MALLDMCRKEGFQLVVAHMNYKKRDTADRDMELVRSYCARFHIPFEARLQTKPCVGNFQAFAREERYRMYRELLQKYQAAAVLLAHHLDDHLETYLMAKERGSMKEYLGIQEEACIMGCTIIRPLMAYSKRELEAYCRENAVPFGIDEEGFQLVVAHMNYKKRDTADRDMELVRSYCARFHIPFEARLQTKPCVGNFQAFAREERYRMYRELLQKYQAAAVLLAHHLDDHLETYLMAKERGSMKEYLGIQEEACIMGCTIIRPLMAYSKRELEAYCRENAVPFGIDESNLTDHYARNRIRHEIVDRMSEKEKEALMETISRENMRMQQLRADCRAFLNSWDGSLKKLRVLDSYFLEQVLITWIHDTCSCYLSMHEIQVLRELIMNNANYWTRDIAGGYDIYSEYGKLVIDTSEEISYSYVYDHAVFEKTPYFETAPHGTGVEAVTLQATDWPITIRNAQPQDAIQLRFGVKKLNRWFIDRKIPKKERKLWPVVVNAAGNVILVPKIGCDIAHFSNNPTLFVLK